MSLIYGKSANGNYALNVKKNGLFWDKLSYHRSQGDCYILNGGAGLNPSILTDRGISSVFNNIVGKKVLVYFIDIGIIGNLTSGSSTLSVETLSSIPTSGTNASGNQSGNFLIGGTIPSTILSLKYNIVSTAFTPINTLYKENISYSSDSTDMDKTYTILNYKDMIEVPYGYGIITRIQSSGTNSVTIQTISNIKFIIVDEDVDF